MGDFVSRSRIVCAEFHEQVSKSLWQEVEVRRAFSFQAVNDRALESLETDRPEFENLRHVIGSRKRVSVAKADERSVLGTGNQSRLGLEHRHTRAFGAHQSAGHVEAV